MPSLGILVGLVAILGLSQDTPLKHTPKIGEVAKYDLKMEVGMFGTDTVYSANVTETTTAVDDKGYTVEFAQSNPKAVVAGDEVPIGETAQTKLSYVYNPEGEIVKVVGDENGVSAYRIALLWSFPLPNKVVKVGDTWVIDRKADSPKGLVESKATYKVEGEESVNDVPGWVISQDFAEMRGNNPMKATGKLWIAKSNGSLLKMVMSWTDAPVPGSATGVTGTVTYLRLP